MTDLVCGEVHNVPKGVAGWHTKEGVATIRKLILCIWHKNRHSNTCRACATTVRTYKKRIKIIDG